VERKKRGDGGRYVREAAQSPEAFARSRRRLEAALVGPCDPRQPWAPRVVAAIHAVLEFAEAEPVAARVIAVHAAFRRYEAPATFGALVEAMAARLSEGAPPTRHPDRTARGIVLRIARQALLQLELHPDTKPTALAPDLVAFALTPYLGFTEAQRWAEAVPEG
jgi:hypothetical protein